MTKEWLKTLTTHQLTILRQALKVLINDGYGDPIALKQDRDNVTAELRSRQ